jgi:Asp-tRNA(Asn)/Glu-tRNA(Gln) amidotransferase A subunit family amidase
VFAAIHGPDGRDPSVVERPFRLCFEASVGGWKIGYLQDAKERSMSYALVLEELAGLGCELVAVTIPEFPVGPLRIILNAEAAAAFDELTRDGRDDQLVRQDESAWPNSFRTSRLIPAVEYINANRHRTQVMLAFDQVMQRVDAIVHPSFHGNLLTLTNLTGHPTLVAPLFGVEEVQARQGERGRRAGGGQSSISFLGRLFEDDRLLVLAQAWQRITLHHRKHPRGD